MKILVAEDNNTSRMMLKSVLTTWGYDAIEAEDGHKAWHILQSENAPLLVLLDWIMPGRDGIEICRRLRELQNQTNPFYIILLTGRDSKKDIVAGLNAGANDYITKPFDNDELCARVNVGRRVLELQSQLARRFSELKVALEHIKTLQGILPICSYCKKIRDDQNYWQQVESYISKITDARFTHSICPDCFDQYVKPQMEFLNQATKMDESAPLNV